MTTTALMKFCCLLAGGASLGAMAGCSSASKDAAKDVAVTACRSDPAGGAPTAQGVVVNHSSKDSTYAFRVSFADSSGNSVSQGVVTLASVAHGATATWHTSGANAARGGLSCRAESVLRTAAP